MTSFAAGLYWRRSKINGARCVPAVLSVAHGRLRLSAADGVAFTPAQLAELGALRARASFPGATGTVGGGALELVAAAFDVATLVATIKPWRTVLPAAGVTVS